MRAKYIKKAGKILLKLLIVVLLLLTALYFTLRSPVAQTWITQRIASYLSDKLNTSVEVGGVDIAFFKKIVLENVRVNDLHSDTLFYANKIKVDIDEFSNKKSKIVIGDIILENATIEVKYYSNDSDYNFQFIKDAFRSTDTTKGNNAPWDVTFNDIHLKNLRFVFIDDSDTIQSQSMDFENLLVTEMNGTIEQFKINDDTLYGYLNNFSLKEKSGFILWELSGQAAVSPVSLTINNMVLRSNESEIKTNLTFTYNEWDDYNYFVRKVNMQAQFNNSHIMLNDIGYFAPELKGLKKAVSLSGYFSGKVNNLKGKNVLLTIDEGTRFKGDFSMSGLPDIDETFLNFKIDELSTSKKLVEKIPMPPFDSIHYISLSPNIDLLGKVTFKGRITGYYYDLVTDGIFKTALGNVSSNIRIYNDEQGDINYSGFIKSSSFDIGRLTFSEKILGTVTMQAKVEGSGVKFNTLKANLKECVIDQIYFNGYNYTNITADGFLAKKIFKGNAKIDDPNAKVNFTGDVDLGKDPVNIVFNADIKKLDLTDLNFVKSKEHITIATNAVINISGNDIDKFTGSINLMNSAYIQGLKVYEIDSVYLTAENNKNERILKLNSGLADATLKGEFKISSLETAITNIIAHYIPNTKSNNKPNIPKNYKYNTLELNVVFKNTEPLTNLFLPNLQLESNSKLHASVIEESNTMDVRCDFKKIMLGNTQLKNIRINTEKTNDAYTIALTGDKYILIDSVSADSIRFNAVVQNNNSAFNLHWKNKGKKVNKGKISGNIDFINSFTQKIIFDPSTIVLNDSVWMLNKNAFVLNDSSSTEIKDFIFKNANQVVGLNGTISNSTNDRLTVYTKDFDLSMLNALYSYTKVKLKGKLSLNGIFWNISNSDNLIFDSNLNFANLWVNEEEGGSGDIRFKYDKASEAIEVNGSLLKNNFPSFAVSGYYFPAKKKNNLDLTVELNDIRLKQFEPYVKEYCSVFRGYVNTKVKVGGEIDNLKLTGEAQLQKVNVRVNYTNTSYSCNGRVLINENSFFVEDLLVYDMNAKTATVRGFLYHNNFKNWQIDFDMNTDKFCILNTTMADNNLYYGKAFVSGVTTFYGFIDQHLKIDANVKTEKVITPTKGVEYTRFNIPLSGPTETTESGFVIFVKKDTAQKKDEYKMDFNGIELNLQIQATADAEMQLIFDEKVGDVIKAKGNGDILLSISPKGDFTIYGEYEVEEGDYLFTLQNIINKKFRIEKGGTITWSGDPYEAQLNLKNIYNLRTSLQPFFTEDSTGIYKKRYPTECILNLTGILMSPDITFDVNLPTVDAHINQTVRSYITTEQEMNKQIFSLLVLNSFQTPAVLSSQGYVEHNNQAGQAAGVASSEVLSNQLSNWLSHISSEFDIGVHYRPGDYLTKDEVELALSTQLFNDKLSIDGSVSNNGNASTQNSSAVVGDVSMDYKITDDGKVRVKAFNKTNDNLNLNNQSQYTQGVGVFYREEFDTLEELYKRYLLKVKTKKNSGS